MGNDSGNRAMMCLAAIREGRRWFDAKMLEHMERHGLMPRDEAIARVRGDDAYHVAEFFYVSRELDLMHRDRLPQLIDRHNADMIALMKDRDRTEAIMGLSPQRVEEAIFSDLHRKKMQEGQEGNGERLQLDQSDICRLLYPLMALETCRKILVALTLGGLLTSRRYGRRRLFISSPGLLEDYFREHLLIIDRAMRDGT